MVTTHEYYLKNKESIELKNKQWREKNFKRYKEYAKKYGKLWRQKNKQKHIIALREWRLKNPEKVRTQNKKWSIEHKEELKQYRKNRYNRNRKRFIEISKVYIKNRLKKDITYRLKHNTLSRIRTLLKVKRNEQIEIFIGYKIEDMQKHLENRFKDGMTWKNYGRITKDKNKVWNIDHVIPLSKIVVNGTYEEVKRAYSLENLQPLWAKDNIAKGNN